MTHLDDELIARAGGTEGADALPAAARAHLDGCAACREQVAGTARLASVLRDADAEAVGETTAPSFDVLIAPALREGAVDSPPMGAAAPAPAALPRRAAKPAMTASWRLTAALVLRQARLLPGLLWPLTAVGFALLLGVVWRAPDPLVGALLFGPGVTLLVTLGALAVCEPRRDPRGELLYAMPVPPVVVWLARLTFVVGIDLLVAMTASLLASTVLAAPVGPLEMIGSWLGAALLGAALAVFGSVWRSPMVGAGFGLSAWAVGVLGLGVVPLPISADASAAVVTVWSTNPATLGAAAALLTASTWLVTRPDRTLPED